MPAKYTANPRETTLDNSKRFYLLHGDDETAIENFKSRIIEKHLERDSREENYREIIPGFQQGGLKRVLGDVLSELSTVSFLPTSRRVVTLYTVSDFFEARARGSKSGKSKAAAKESKKSASDHLADFIEKEMPNLPSVLIIIALEDYEKWKKIAPANPVVALAQRTNSLIAFKESSPQFGFFDALFARNAELSLKLWREWLERAPASPKPYYQLAAQLRLLIQAKTAVSGQLQSRGVTTQKFATDFLPKEFDRNLFSLKPEWRQDKMKNAAANFTFTELLQAYEKLHDLQKFAIPLNSDPYVPDKHLLSEIWILEFTSPKSDRI
jgi:DNA polymerase III delta subunit